MPILIGYPAAARRSHDGAVAKTVPATANLVTVRRVTAIRSVMSFLSLRPYSVRLALADLERVGQESTVSPPLERYFVPEG
jgi:hypothetical protein